jgi:predicted O-linked N-acetylglucosamine transferase (SPINDLY family)
MTQQIRSLADGWRDIRAMSDIQAASSIREDRNDLLIDLSGHMAGNRLTLFALRPAPVQITAEDFLRIATDLATDADRLRRLRLNMRDRLGASILGNAVAYTRRFESAVRQSWMP